MNRIITYAVDDEGIVYSRVGSEVAVPVLQFDQIGKDGDFTKPFEYKLERCTVPELASAWHTLRWTKKIPITIKNQHRQFWGMPKLREAA